MCGIAGVFHFNRDRDSRPLVEKMISSLLHRGPDDSGCFASSNVGLGMCRLSIIDLSSGKQPMQSEDGNLVVVQNGEIYNFIELRQELIQAGCRFRTRSDTEVLLHLYERFGKSFVEKLNGMFCIALFDRISGELILARDRAGKKPLFIYQDAEKLLFASEIKALLHAGVRPELDSTALNHYLSLNFVPLPKTIFRGISHLAPAHIFAVKRDGRSHSRCYWQFPMDTQSLATASTLQSLEETFFDAIRIRLRADVPVGIFLSGGLDSSAIAAAASGLSGHPTHSFCAGFEDPAFDEANDAKVVADAFRLEHHAIAMNSSMFCNWPKTIWHCDQPHGDTSFLPMYLLSKEAKKYVKVVLTGEGSDEIFAGYDWHRASSASSLTLERFEQNSVFTEAEKSELFAEPRSANLPNSFSLVEECMSEAENLDNLNRMLYLDFKVLLPGNNLVKSDRMGMAQSIEPRSPFLDFRLVELAFRISGASKVSAEATKACFREMIARYLPPSTIAKKKQMFATPFEHWVKGEGIAWARELILSKRSTSRGFFRISGLKGLLDVNAMHNRNNIRKLRALMAFEIWCRVFLDGNWQRQPTVDSIGLEKAHQFPARN